MTTLPKITKKEQEIIRLLYSFRYLNRIQIQVMLGHKDYKTINAWLRDLREKQYIGWIYSTHFAERTKPAIYYLSLGGMRYLRQFTRIDEYGDEVPSYPTKDLRKRYQDSNRSQTFIDHCLLVAECCVAQKKNDTDDVRHFYQTEADYIREPSYYNFILDSELIRPSLCFCTFQRSSPGKVKTLQSWILEVFDPTQPRYIIRRRLSNYIKYLDEPVYEWMRRAKTQKLPTLLLVCPGTSDLIYAKRKMRRLVAEAWEYRDDERPYIMLTTTDKLKAAGIMENSIWEKA